MGGVGRFGGGEVIIRIYCIINIFSIKKQYKVKFLVKILWNWSFSDTINGMSNNEVIIINIIIIPQGATNEISTLSGTSTNDYRCPKELEKEFQ